MRISDLAQILQLTSKEIIQEVENLRDALTNQGFKIAKRLTASSSLDDDAVRLLMAEVDIRRRDAQKKVDEEAAAARRAEEEARRREDGERRAREEAERQRQAEEARRKADEALALEQRRREAQARVAPPVPPPSVAPPPPPSLRTATPAAVAPPAAPPVLPVRPPAPPPPAPTAAADSAPVAERPASTRPAGRPAARDDQGPRRKDVRPEKRTSAPDVGGFVDSGFGTTVEKEGVKARRRPDVPDRGKKPATTDEEGPRKRRLKPGEGGRKIFRPTQVYEGEAVKSRRPSTRPGAARKGRGGMVERQEERPKVFQLTGDFTVGQFAERTGVQSAEIIGKLLGMGKLLTINQILEPDLAELIAMELGIEIRIERESDESDIADWINLEDDPADLRPRPPVVTVMGHVDHGKTTLLDTIRDANVADSEHGGITQAIGAYFVKTDKGDIVFLDTPGHAAFTAMRARGANVTDLVVLVVAANDGVKPQTVEAINHAKAAEVPIVVAINKIDVEGANITRVKNELMSYELVSEDLGGETIMVEVSAKSGKNVQALLEMIALQAEVLELKANPNRPAVGTIIESKIDPNRGAVATVLVTEGTLHTGDIFVCGTESGRIRAMRNDKGEALEQAGPATPVEILGLSGSPAAGEAFVVLEDEAEAREIAERRVNRRKTRAAKAVSHVSLDTIGDHLAKGAIKDLNLIVKADVQGSVEAIVASLEKIESDRINLRILHSGVGAITEGDVHLADASDAIIVGFKVRPDPYTRDLAQDLGVEIRTYSIIYELLEEIESAMLGMLEPVFEQVAMSTIEVREVFRIGKLGNIAGCFVSEGTVARDHRARLLRGGTVVWEGKVASLRRHKDEAREVVAGLECGIGLENFHDIKTGDVIETYVLKQLAASLVSAPSGAGSA
ncbi:MAG: translation initiation factor IF-2 [Candidatus Sumerlaeia bacterium]|nr:translation initiation factor IF-2 [Candidatus Sumerlaeia bacterium]